MAATNVTPQERVRIFRKDGTAAAEFRARVQRSWVIGDEARAEFVLSSNRSNYVNEDVILPGNWLVVQNSALPSWVGVIDEPINWGTRNVTLSAYTPEHI